jgi:molecular chaperone HscB
VSVIDPFAALGIERCFDVDLALAERRHRELSRVLHPDKHAGGGASEKREALSRAILVNEAWRIVRDPVRRAEALFALAGIPVGENNEPKPDPAFLMEMMEERENLGEARASGDTGRVRASGQRIEARSKRALDALSAGFSQANQDPSVLGGLVARLGELRFYRRFLDEVKEVDDPMLAVEGG